MFAEISSAEWLSTGMLDFASQPVQTIVEKVAFRLRKMQGFTLRIAEEVIIVDALGERRSVDKVRVEEQSGDIR